MIIEDLHHDISWGNVLINTTHVNTDQHDDLYDHPFIDVVLSSVEYVPWCQCNISIPGTLESTLEPSECLTSDIPWSPGLWTQTSWTSWTLALWLWKPWINYTCSTYIVVVSSNYNFSSPDEGNWGCASTLTCCLTLLAHTSEVVHNAASIVLLHWDAYRSWTYIQYREARKVHIMLSNLDCVCILGSGKQPESLTTSD